MAGDSGPPDVMDKQLHLVTPTILSQSMAKICGFPVYLKLENLQPPGSFKIRGVGNMCKKAVKRGCTNVVCASGGNGGLATAYAAQQLGITATIVLPTTTPDFLAEYLRDLGANVVVHGKVFNDSNSHALELSKQPGSTFIHPFNHPDIWEGHTSLMKEAVSQMPCRPDLIITCVGGGGLLSGIIHGMHIVGWKDTPVIAMETKGAESFNAAVNAGKVVTLPAITSIANCLGSLTICQEAFDLQQRHTILSVVVDDKEAIKACLKFADDHRMIVEPACGATLAAIYSDVIPQLQKEGKLGAIKSALVVVCGGASVTLSALDQWKQQFGL